MIVEVHVLFSKNNKIGSKIIAKGTKHLESNMPETSHTALLVNNRWVHESTGASGVRIISYDLWKTHQQEVCRIKLEDREYQIIADQYRQIKNKKYDYPGVVYLGLMIIPTFLGFKLPKKNKWESKDKYFCCEALGKLTNTYYGMSAPIQIMGNLLNGKDNKN